MKTKFDKRKSKVNQTLGCYGNIVKSIPEGYDASLKQTHKNKETVNVAETDQQVPEKV
jgi:hypothetical protein